MLQIIFQCYQACPINTSQNCSAGLVGGWVDVTREEMVRKPFAALCFGRAWVCCQWGCACPVTWAKKEEQQLQKYFCFLGW